MTRIEFEARLREGINHAQQVYSGYHRPNELLTRLIGQEVMALLDEAGLLGGLTNGQDALERDQLASTERSLG